MLKVLCLLTCALSLSLAIAGDNLALKKNKSVNDLSPDLVSLGGGQAMVNKTYEEKEKIRSDKVYYTASHSYESSFKLKDIALKLGPTNLGHLFEETTVEKFGDVYNVHMLISTPVQDFDCASTLHFKKEKNVFLYTFSDFNIVFTSMVIKIEVHETDSGSKVNLTQVAAVKGSTYSKLSSIPFAVGRFEKSLKDNMRKLKDALGAVD